MRLTISLPFDTGEWVEVEAEMLFDLAPHLADVATFAVHRDPCYMVRWKVSNVETGLVLSKGETRKQAIHLAKQICDAKDVSDLERAYAKAFKAYPNLKNGTV